MADSNTILYPIAIFLVSLFVLDFGVDRFITYTVKLGRRFRLDPGLIALLTVGGEWEELTVIVAAVAQGQSRLAMGNVVGSCISNILGAFCLGLIFSRADAVTFDRSARVYTVVALALTALFVVFVAAGEALLGRFGGFLLVVAFVAYVACVAWAIWKGIVEAPVGDDCCGGGDAACDSEEEGDDEETEGLAARGADDVKKTCTSSCGDAAKPEAWSRPGSQELATRSSAETLEAIDLESAAALPPTVADPPRGPSTLYYIAQLLFGLATLSLSSYTLSHAMATLAGSFGLSSTVLGSTVLSFATTLPEKLVSVVSSRRGESGLLVATTAGSNIFLVTLCAGVLFLTGDLAALRASVGLWEMSWVVVSAGVLGVVVLGKWGGRRWMGWAMLGAYIVFLIGEFWIGGA